MNLAHWRPSLAGVTWFLGLMLLFWAPLPGEQRLPALFLIGLGLWYWARQGTTGLPGLKQMQAFLILMAIPALASLPNSVTPLDTLGILVVLAVFYPVGIALLRGFGSRPSRWLVLGIGITLFLWSLDALYQWTTGASLLGYALNPDGRVWGPFKDNQRLGFLTGALMSIPLIHLARTRPLAAMALYALFTFVVGLAAARAALVFALLSGIGLFLCLPGLKYRLGLVAGLAGVIGGALVLSPIHTERVLERDYTRYLNQPGLERGEALFLQVDDFLSGRLKIWHTGWNMFADRPLAGVGAGAFDEAYDQYSTRPDDQFTTRGGYPGGVHHAHQMYVSAAAETGLVGLLSLATILYMLWRWYRRLPPEGRRRALPYGIALMVAAFPINSQHGAYVGWWFSTLFFMVCAMLAAGEQGRRKDSS